MIDLDQIISRIENEPKQLLSGRDIAYVLRAFREERGEVERLRAALRQILEDPDAQILDSHRDDGWAVLGHS